MQDKIALSSGEAELKAACKCVAELLEVRQVMDFITGEAANLTLALDAQATQGMVLRQGHGKLKHLSVRSLWIQETVCELQIQINKIPRSHNHADALCSFHTVTEFHGKLAAMCFELEPRHARRGGCTGEPARRRSCI